MLKKSDIIAQTQAVRDSVEEFLTDYATIWHKIDETVVDGISTPIYINETNVPVRLVVKAGASNSNIPAQFRDIAQLMFTGNYRLQIPLDSTIREGDQVEIYGRFFDAVYVPPVMKTTGARMIGLQEIQ